MKTENGLLKMYMQALFEWVEDGCTEPSEFGFTRNHAICSNFYAFIGRSRVAQKFYPSGYPEASQELSAIFAANCDCPSYPFGGFKTFYAENRASNFFTNPERLAFIKAFNEANKYED